MGESTPTPPEGVTDFRRCALCSVTGDAPSIVSVEGEEEGERERERRRGKGRGRGGRGKSVKVPNEKILQSALLHSTLISPT